MMGEGDMVGACNTVSGAHRGEFLGIPATWKSFTVNNADHCRFTEDNLICEHWA
jgi:predicted ester cyclase